MADRLQPVVWTYFEQAALERALRDEFSRKVTVGSASSASAASSLGDLNLWRRLAEAVNVGAKTAAELHAFAAARRVGPPKSAADCLQRFLALRAVARRWHERHLGENGESAAASSSAGASASAGTIQSAGALVAPPVARPIEPAAPAAAPTVPVATAPQPGPSAAAARRQAVLAAADRELRAEEAADDERAAARAAARKAAVASAAAAATDARARGAAARGDGSATADGEDGDAGSSDDEKEDDDHPREHGHHDHDHADDDDEEDEEEDEDPASLGAATSFAGIELTPAHKGYRIGLPGLSLFGVGTLAAAQIDVALQCSRCSTMVTATLQGAKAGAGSGAGSSSAGAAAASGAGTDGSSSAPAGGAGAGAGAAASGVSPAASAAAPAPAPASATATASGWQAWCPKCSLLLSLALRPTLLHEGDPTVGYIDCPSGHAVPTTVNTMRLLCTCLECGALAEVPRLSPPTHRTWESSCRSCFTRLRLDARTVDVAAASVAPPPALGAWKHSRTGAGTRGAQRLIPGRPLPDGGTCKHYGQSYRWLRFPCCGVAFPCDVCHDAASDHPSEWARRMICGHCAREQPFSSTAPCVACGRFLSRRSGPICECDTCHHPSAVLAIIISRCCQLCLLPSSVSCCCRFRLQLSVLAGSIVKAAGWHHR